MGVGMSNDDTPHTEDDLTKPRSTSLASPIGVFFNEKAMENTM